MHQKKSEIQIGKESIGISSDFNPIPPLLFPSITQKHNNFHQILNFSNPQFQKNPNFTHKRPPIKSQQILPFSKIPASNFKSFSINSSYPSFIFLISTAKSAIFRLIRKIRVHIKLIVLISLPILYLLITHPSRSFILDFLSAFCFLATLLFFSLNFDFPSLPSIRVFFDRSLTFSGSRRNLPVLWSIGSKSKVEKKLTSGCWFQVYSNGDVYEGEFHKGKCSGSGVFYYYMSGRYEGDWVDGKYDGYGVETWARGSRFRGQFRHGLRHGFGVYRFYTGDVYRGEWSNGQSHGCGIHTCEDASRYVGEFKCGVKHGLGHYHFRNGDTYAGEYFANKMHGYGVYTFTNGHRYEGAWHEGRRQGLGIYTVRSGDTKAGQWNNGILDIPSNQNDSGPVSPVAVYHSKVLNAVQEARRAAEKAYDVAKVDERVNRAVISANRAATAARVAAVKAVQKQIHHEYDSKHDCLPFHFV